MMPRFFAPLVPALALGAANALADKAETPHRAASTLWRAR